MNISGSDKISPMSVKASFFDQSSQPGISLCLLLSIVHKVTLQTRNNKDSRTEGASEARACGAGRARGGRGAAAHGIQPTT